MNKNSKIRKRNEKTSGQKGGKGEEVPSTEEERKRKEKRKEKRRSFRGQSQRIENLYLNKIYKILFSEFYLFIIHQLSCKILGFAAKTIPKPH